MTTAPSTAPQTTDLQSLFTSILTKQWAQAAQAMSDDGNMCAYRGTDNHRCAVGCLIPDDVYDTRIESATVSDVMTLATTTTDEALEKVIFYARIPSVRALRDVLAASGLTPDTFPLLAALQRVHDDQANPHAWPAAWAATADTFGLTMPVLGPMGGGR